MQNQTKEVVAFNPSDYDVSPIERVPSYWAPEEEGETKFVEYLGTEVRKQEDINNPGEMIELETVLFLDLQEGIVYGNSSKRLIGAFDTSKAGQLFQVRYLGKRKNKTNAYQSDHWSVRDMVKKKTDNMKSSTPGPKASPGNSNTSTTQKQNQGDGLPF